MAPPRGRGAPPLLLIALSAAFLTYNALLSSRSFLPLPSASFPDAAAAFSSSRRLAVGGSGGTRLFHTAVTASGSVYNTWQCRVMYHWFKEATSILMNKQCKISQFFSRSHSTKTMYYLCNFLCGKLFPNYCSLDLSLNRVHPKSQGYIVLNRPWAFVQWLQKADIQEEYILMAEPDHLIVKPIPNLSRDGRAAAFPFFYIEPKKYEKVLRKFFPETKGPIINIDPIGNSPVIIEKESLSRIAPTWMNISLAMKKDPDADKAFGWVLEM